MEIINRPVFFKRSAYEEAVAFIVQHLGKEEGIKAIYQFGNITTPGISDIDLLVVFKDEYKSTLNGFENFPKHLAPLFTHGIWALNEKHFGWNNYYSIWSENHLMFGENPDTSYLPERNPDETKILKTQIALEYLLMNYIDIKIQIEYGSIKLRSMLQHVKGIRYDLEFLDITDSWMHPMIAQLNHWIREWFENTPADKKISEFFNDFNKAYDRFFSEIIEKNKLFLPYRSIYPISKNIIIHTSSKTAYKRNGILLPSLLSPLLGKKYAKLQNKLNTFSFETVISNETPPKILSDRLIFLAEMKKYNDEYLPNFTTLTTAVTAKLI